MKHNPKLHERVAALPGNARLHPLAGPAARAGGARADVAPPGGRWPRSRACRTSRCSPARARTASWPACCSPAPTTRTGARPATRSSRPTPSHGTNPATVTMAGYELVKLATQRGRRHRPRRPARQGDRGRRLPDAHQPQHAGALRPATSRRSPAIVHGVGATLYYDGANLNAIVGVCRPGDMGFDIVHFNLHKTFTQPHGGGGPGAGPIAVSDRIEPYLPRAAGRPPRGGQRRRAGVRPRLRPAEVDRPPARLPGQLRRVRALLRVHPLAGADGLKEMSETAVLNANYLLARLKEQGVAEYLPVAYDRLCMHEFVLSGAPMKRELKIKTLDLAKRLLDHGVPPADGLLPAARRRGAADRADRDRDEGDARRLRRRRSPRSCARPTDDPTIAQTAPHTTPVRRLDEAARGQAAGHPPAAVARLARRGRGSDAQRERLRRGRLAVRGRPDRDDVAAGREAAGDDADAARALAVGEAAMRPRILRWPERRTVTSTWAARLSV